VVGQAQRHTGRAFMNHHTIRRVRFLGQATALLGVAAAFVASTGWVVRAEAAIVYCYGKPATVVGTAGNETINASDGVTEGDDVINGLGGNDRIAGLGGDDIICGGAGTDGLHGDGGDDKIAGNAGDDVILGDDGFDWLEGFEGDDLIMGGPEWDRVEGGDANEFNINLDWGNDRLYGDSGEDYVRGAAGDDVLNGGNGHDQLWGMSGDDALRDTQGDNDLLFGALGDDFIDARDTSPTPDGDDVIGSDGIDICATDANDDRLRCETL
jgi:Ca2+-binding RTX toxin-like protein